MELVSSEFSNGLPSMKRAFKYFGSLGREPKKPGVLLRRKITASSGMEPSTVRFPLSLLYARPRVESFVSELHCCGIGPVRPLFASERYAR
jgi:hypothetical protein